jgi:hypothetical protein
MRAFLLGVAIAGTCLGIAVLPLGAQDVRVVGIVPEKPVPGSSFVVVLALAGTPADKVEPLEPELVGPARYDGADVRPDAADAASATVNYRFTATGTGRVDVRRLSVRVRGRTLNLGSWVVEIESASTAPVRRYGTWSAPGSVWARQTFLVAALDPDGAPAECPPFAVEGAIVEPRPGTPGAYSVTVLEPGSWRLPALELEGAGGKFSLKSRDVMIKALPGSASGARSVGGPWRLEIVEPQPEQDIKPGDTIAWEIRAVGAQSSGFADAPSITVTGPSGESIRLDAGVRFFSESRSAQSVVGARGVFTVTEPGKYSVLAEPYAWFDTDTGTLRRSVAPALRFTVTAPLPPAVEPPAVMIEYAARMLASKAGGSRADDAFLVPAGASLEAGDWTAARSAVSGLLGIPDARGALAQARLSPKDALLAASVHFLAGDRAEAYAVFLRLEKSGFPPKGTKELAGAAATSIGNLDRTAYVLPAFGVLAVPGVLALALTVLGFATRKRYAFVAALIAVFVAGSAAVSLAERSVHGFVSLGAVARKVPSDTASVAYTLDAGKTGRILESAGNWLFIEPANLEAAWISVDDAVRY